MEYAKNDMFQIRYNTNLNRLEMKKEIWTSRLWKKVKGHKLITTTIITLFMLATINIVMIHSFMKILQNL